MDPTQTQSRKTPLKAWMSSIRNFLGRSFSRRGKTLTTMWAPRYQAAADPRNTVQTHMNRESSSAQVVGKWMMLRATTSSRTHAIMAAKHSNAPAS